MGCGAGAGLEDTLKPARIVLSVLCSLLAACSTPGPRPVPPVHEGGAPVEESPWDGAAQGQPAVIAPLPSGQRPRGAVLALLERSEQYRRAGDVESASAALERALRIAPRDALLWHRLARLRLEQGLAAEAEQLALKSNALSGTDRVLQARNWALVARARWARDDSAGARAAERRAAALRD